MNTILVLAALLLPTSAIVEMTVVPDKTCYFVGEPMVLVLHTRNVSTSRIYAPYKIDLHQPRALRRIDLALCDVADSCRDIQSVVKNPALYEETNFEIDLHPLAPGHTTPAARFVVVADAAARLVLDAPGQYRLRVTRWGSATDPHGHTPQAEWQVSSQTPVIRVVAPPAHERDALASYQHPEILALAERPGTLRGLGSVGIEAALEFLRKYPSSLYVTPIVDGLKVALPLRAMEKNATEAEREAYEMLKRKEFPDPHVPECR